MRFGRYVLLAFIGGLAAILAFRLSAPFESSLDRSHLVSTDPTSLYTFGTEWATVNHFAFGALICGPFCFVLSLGRRSMGQAALAGVVGTVVGALVNSITDSGSDLIGIEISKSIGSVGNLVASLAWCVLVPAGIATTIAISMGVTRQRVQRAIFATKIAAVASFGAQILGMFSSGLVAEGAETLRSQIPVWRMEEIAVGVVIGLTIAFADQVARTGSLRLIHGRNEFRDWSLDHTFNRIGKAESCEVPVFGFQGVEPVHATVVRQGTIFFLDPVAPTLINSRAAGRVTLSHGDTIGVGTAQFVFYVRDFVQPRLTSPPSTWQEQPPTPSPARLLLEATGQEMRLPPGRYGVGRDSVNAICIDNDSSISRLHAEVLVGGSSLTVIDLGSTNGTRLNGVRFTGQTLVNPGDVVEFGLAKFIYFR
jgi:pSer/pThr/pTyr-binding forkhead associated (FHA) protein